jgi:hypothetical protein
VGYPLTQAWVASVTDQVSHQVAARHLLSSCRSTAAIESPIGKIRDYLDSRSFVLRNANRLNQALGLMRLNLNKDDRERDYLSLLRQAVENGNGHAPQQRSGYDPPGVQTLR